MPLFKRNCYNDGKNYGNASYLRKNISKMIKSKHICLNSVSLSRKWFPKKLTSWSHIPWNSRLNNSMLALVKNKSYLFLVGILWHIGNDQSVIKKVVPKEVDIPVTYPCMHCANWFLMYLREYVMAFSKKVMLVHTIYPSIQSF